MIEMNSYFLCSVLLKWSDWFSWDSYFLSTATSKWLRWTVTLFAYVTSNWFRWTVTSFALQHQNGFNEQWLPLHCSIKMVEMNCYFLWMVVVKMNKYFPCIITSKRLRSTVNPFVLGHQNDWDEQLLSLQCAIKMIRLVEMRQFLSWHCNIEMVEMNSCLLCIVTSKKLRWTVTSFAYATSKWFRWTVTSFAL